MEKSFRKVACAHGGLHARTPECELAWFARQLWRAFPEAVSENELSELAADTLSRDGKAVTARTVRNWLRGENAPGLRYVIAVLALVGAEAVFEIIDPEDREAA